MNYTIAGTGNMAYFLTNRLQAAGWRCNGVWGRSRPHAEQLAATIPAEVIPHLSAMPKDAGICIIAVADHAIEEVSRQLPPGDAVIIHTAGSVSLEALVQDSKAILWPVYSITKNDLPKQPDIPVICEANTIRSQEMVLALAHVITDNVQMATSMQRQWMHLIAAFSNNFTNHIITIAELLSREHQIDFNLFQPILHQTFERIAAGDAFKSQTGAAKRKDAVTMEKHLSLLATHPQWQALYRTLSSSIKDLYNGSDK